MLLEVSLSLLVTRAVPAIYVSPTISKTIRITTTTTNSSPASTREIRIVGRDEEPILGDR
jgi:hypothetical protein